MPQVTFSSLNQNLKLYYEVHGSGEVKILFIMGLFTDGAAWCRQVSVAITLTLPLDDLLLPSRQSSSLNTPSTK